MAVWSFEITPGLFFMGRVGPRQVGKKFVNIAENLFSDI